MLDTLRSVLDTLARQQTCVQHTNTSVLHTNISVQHTGVSVHNTGVSAAHRVQGAGFRISGLGLRGLTAGGGRRHFPDAEKAEDVVDSVRVEVVGHPSCVSNTVSRVIFRPSKRYYRKHSKHCVQHGQQCYFPSI